MASTAGQLNFVQQTYTDNWTRGYPGQLADEQTYLSEGLDTFPVEGNIIMGRGVVIGTIQTATTTDPSVSTAPYTVTLPDTGTVAADLVGVAVRPFVTTTNIEENNVQIAGYPDKSLSAILPFGCRKTILVSLLAGTTVAVNDPVYLAIGAANAAGIEIGEFTNVAGLELLLVPNAVWYESKTATTDDAVSVIKLN